MEKLFELNNNYNGLFCKINDIREDKENDELNEIQENTIANIKKVFKNFIFNNQKIGEGCFEFYNHNFRDIGLNIVIYSSGDIERKTDNILYVNIYEPSLFFDDKYFKRPTEEQVEKFKINFNDEMRELGVLCKVFNNDTDYNKFVISDDYYINEDNYIYNIKFYTKKKNI